MIHINKSTDKKYYVTVISPNGKILSTSETFNSKESAWKNIAAMCDTFFRDNVDVIDSTVKIFGKYNFDCWTKEKTKTLQWKTELKSKL